MTTSREKVNQITDIITEEFGIKEVSVFMKKIDVHAEIGKKVAGIEDSKLDDLVQKIKKVVNED